MSGIPRSVRNKVADRDDFCCCRCGKYAQGGSIHHRKLRSQGGLDVPSNLILLDGSGSSLCHGWCHENRTEAGDLGLIVPSWEDPADVPVYYFGRWVRLDDHGNTTPTAAPLPPERGAA